MKNSVNIKLTDAQKDEIKNAIGADVEELRFTVINDVVVDVKGKLGESPLGEASPTVRSPGAKGGGQR